MYEGIYLVCIRSFIFFNIKYEHNITLGYVYNQFLRFHKKKPLQQISYIQMNL